MFYVDEAAHIGQMHALEDAVTLLRGSGIRIWLFLQSLEQLKKCFGENANTVLDNLGTQQFFGITSFETAKMLSERMGDQTLVIRTDSGNEGRSTPTGGDGKGGGSYSSGTSYNISEIARRLMKPEEILVLPPTTALVFHKNSYVCICDRITYFTDRAFRRGGIGRTPSLGLSGMALALMTLMLSVVATAMVASMPVPVPRPPRQRPGWQAMPDASPYASPYGMSPLPYRVRRAGDGRFNSRFTPDPPPYGGPGSFLRFSL
jgi:type IV secretion system protein VirD4